MEADATETGTETAVGGEIHETMIAGTTGAIVIYSMTVVVAGEAMIGREVIAGATVMTCGNWRVKHAARNRHLRASLKSQRPTSQTPFRFWSASAG